MSDIDNENNSTNTTTTTTNSSDEIKNLKGEFNRKLDSGLSDINKRLEQLMGQLAQKNEPPKPPKDEVNLSDLMYSNPEKYAEIIAERATKTVETSLHQKNEMQSRQNRVIADLVNNYPELQDNNSELYKASIEKFNKLDDYERGQTSAWKSVVLDAALELDVKPKSKRRTVEENQDDFVMNSNSSINTRRPIKKDGDLDPRTLEFAKLIGLDVEKKEVKEGLKKSAQRKDWKRYS